MIYNHYIMFATKRKVLCGIFYVILWMAIA